MLKRKLKDKNEESKDLHKMRNTPVTHNDHGQVQKLMNLRES